MLRFVSILLVTFYSLIAIGLSVSISFCGNRIVDIQFFQEAEYCCKTPKKCCSKVNLSFELQEEVKPIDFLKIKFQNLKITFGLTEKILIPFKTLLNDFFLKIKTFESKYFLSETRLYLMFCCLKICENNYN